MPVLAVALVIQRSGPDAASQNAVRTVRQATETDQEVLPAPQTLGITALPGCNCPETARQTD